MNTWEYAVLKWQTDIQGDITSYWSILGSGEGTSVQPDHWDQRIAEAGREGWEMVSHAVAGGDLSAGETVYFRRPL